jgi:hypothetical protein
VEEKPAKESIDAWRKVVEIDPTLTNYFDEPEIRLEMPTRPQLQKMLKEKAVKQLGSG